MDLSIQQPADHRAFITSLQEVVNKGQLNKFSHKEMLVIKKALEAFNTSGTIDRDLLAVANEKLHKALERKEPISVLPELFRKTLGQRATEAEIYASLHAATRVHFNDLNVQLFSSSNFFTLSKPEQHKEMRFRLRDESMVAVDIELKGTILNQKTALEEYKNVSTKAKKYANAARRENAFKSFKKAFPSSDPKISAKKQLKKAATILQKNQQKDEVLENYKALLRGIPPQTDSEREIFKKVEAEFYNQFKNALGIEEIRVQKAPSTPSLSALAEMRVEAAESTGFIDLPAQLKPSQKTKELIGEIRKEINRSKERLPSKMSDRIKETLTSGILSNYETVKLHLAPYVGNRKTVVEYANILNEQAEFLTTQRDVANPSSLEHQLLNEQINNLQKKSIFWYRYGSGAEES